jgi:hypothetical protein
MFGLKGGIVAPGLVRSARLEDGDLEGAKPQLEEALKMAQAHLPPDHRHLAEYRATLEVCRKRMRS